MCSSVAYFSSNNIDSIRLGPFSKQQADTLSIVRPSNTLSDRRTDVDRDQLLAQGLVLSLWNGVRDLRTI